ncbi:MAG: 2-C-methyl-D-erythritol 4-phosphate cytidylyltransferase [Burkholderiales bacterium]|nr:MAG: 2-C-methyl-D-erythritol 4-phosphate cytidylyltransferase [Burkholderiales bacterium]
MSSSESPAPQPSLPARCHALLPCAGSGSRAGAAVPKQYRTVAGLPMVMHTLAAFAAEPRIASIRVVVAPSDRFLNVDDPRIVLVRRGGLSRAESVFNGLQSMLDEGVSPSDWVLVHDAARCLVTPADIARLIDACQGDEVGGLLALPLPDTLKQERAGRAAATVDRVGKWLAQTPQMFRLGRLHAALDAARTDAFTGITDEASAVERTGLRPLLVAGSARNFKVTYPEDFAMAEALLAHRT